MIIRLLVIVLMIYFTAFFVASEFSLVKIRSSQLEHLKNEGNKKAILALDVVKHLDEYLSACQLGITLTSLAIGWLGESTIEALIHPVLSYLPLPNAAITTISLVLAFLIVTFIHVVIGELVPKSISIARTEKVVLSVVKPLHIFFKITYPFIWLLNHSAIAIGKLFGIQIVGEGEETHTEDELLYIASHSYKHGQINKDELNYLNNIFEFDELIAKEIMVNRIDMEVLEVDTSIQEALKTAVKMGHTRYPVIQDSKDEVIGYITLQQLVKASLDQSNQDQSIAPLAVEPILALETIPIKKLLKTMQTEHKHFAILLDEYGGTSGLITIEDILEEIVGDIQDEADNETALIKKISKTEYIIDGKTEIDEIEDLFHLQLEEIPDIMSISGYLINQYHNQIKTGNRIIIQNVEFTILSVHHLVIHKLKARVLPENPQQESLEEKK